MHKSPAVFNVASWGNTTRDRHHQATTKWLTQDSPIYDIHICQKRHYALDEMNPALLSAPCTHCGNLLSPSVSVSFVFPPSCPCHVPHLGQEKSLNLLVYFFVSTRARTQLSACICGGRELVLSLSECAPDCLSHVLAHSLASRANAFR